MRLPRVPRRDAPPPGVAPGEKVLAWCWTTDGTVLAGTRDALHVGASRIPWEEVEAADWDLEAELLRVSEVGSWGEQRPVHAFTISDPGRLLELLRERITASIVIQRSVPVHGRRGPRVIARRAPRGDQPVRWVYEYDEGIDPDDPQVLDAARTALVQARRELGIE